MAPYYPIYICRSDGKTILSSKSTKDSPNQPTPEQLDKKPDANGICDFYREVPTGEAKEVDWRRKLAGMLMREIGGKDNKDRNYILAALPENYRVWEHVKCKISEVDGKPQKPTKNHAAGSNERQDAYLYGHPSGPKKRYRSPAEFFPHLFWLATDQNGDNDNCSCKFCSPEELQDDKSTAPAVKDTKSEVTKPQEAPKVPLQNNTPLKKPTPQSTRPIGPSPLPRIRTKEQEIDLQYGRFLYRPGEVVWFSRGSAWGLGMVVNRSQSQYVLQEAQYTVQPLSHPFGHPEQCRCENKTLRPWLAWSPPPLTNENLNPNPQNSNRNYTYDNIDWAAVIGKKFGDGDAEVDGSIMAAKAVEMTFTPIEPVSQVPISGSSGQVVETYYNGIYLGGERIWVGEPLRLRNSAAATDVLILHSIVETPNPRDVSRPRMTVVGDVYGLCIVQLQPDYTPKEDTNLPVRLRKDLEFRNNITWHNPDMTKRYTQFWKLLTPGARFDTSNVKGRWYESSLMLPVLDAGSYESSRARGEIGDAGLWMNGLGDCNRPLTGPASRGSANHFKPPDLKVHDRRTAFGKSLPPNLRIGQRPEEIRNGGQNIKLADEDTTMQGMTSMAPQGRVQQQQNNSYGAGHDNGVFIEVPSLVAATEFDQYMRFDDQDQDQYNGQGPGANDPTLVSFGQQYGTEEMNGGGNFYP